MLKVHLSDGRTLRFALDSPTEAAEWIRLSSRSEFQRSITGLSILDRGVQYSLPRPEEFGSIVLSAERAEPSEIHKFKGGTRMIAQADDVRIVVMVHAGHKAVRVGVSRTGRLRYAPNQLDRASLGDPSLKTRTEDEGEG